MNIFNSQEKSDVNNVFHEDALQAYSRKPDCFKRAASVIRIRCTDLDMNEDARVNGNKTLATFLSVDFISVQSRNIHDTMRSSDCQTLLPPSRMSSLFRRRETHTRAFFPDARRMCGVRLAVQLSLTLFF